jgi:hypothetical protein
MFLSGSAEPGAVLGEKEVAVIELFVLLGKNGAGSVLKL